MRFRRCAREDAVRAASASGRWTPALTVHASVCATCREVKTVTEALAAPLATSAPAVNPVVLWARARQASNVATAARMARILTAAQMLSASVVLVLLISAAVVVALSGTPQNSSTRAFSGMAEMALGAGVLLTGAAVWLSRWATRP